MKILFEIAEFLDIDVKLLDSTKGLLTKCNFNNENI